MGGTCGTFLEVCVDRKVIGFTAEAIQKRKLMNFFKRFLNRNAPGFQRGSLLKFTFPLHKRRTHYFIFGYYRAALYKTLGATWSFFPLPYIF